MVQQQQVRVDQQVAQAPDHPARRGLAQAIAVLVVAAEIGPVLRIRPVAPQHHVTAAEVEVTAVLLPVHAAQLHGVHGVAPGAARPPSIRSGDVRGVRGMQVVAVDAAFQLQLPVAGIGIGRLAAQQFQPLLALVDQQVDAAGGRPQVVAERRHRGVQAGEDEAAVAVHARQAAEAVLALVELWRVGAVLFLEHRRQLAVEVEAPAVRRAAEVRHAALSLAQQRGAVVRTGVDEHADVAALVAADDDRLAPDGQGDEIARIRNLALVGQVHPAALEDAFQFQVEQFRVGVQAAVEPAHAIDGPLIQVGAETRETPACAWAVHDEDPCRSREIDRQGDMGGAGSR
ncbi:MAG: hypothetical protein OZX49_02418 [Immundisolibacter sp.]|nr:hypothetical protein [Immundisolibacter sp.]